jgi:hypothetical protein
MRAVAILLLTLPATIGFAGEIYTWRDSSGRVHYSDTPPPGQQTRTLRGAIVEVPPPPSAASQSGAAGQPQAAAKPGGAKSIQEQDLEFRKRRAQAAEEQAKKDKELAMAEDKRRNCEEAKSRLAALESGQRIARFNAQGEREFLDDSQRDAEIERARKGVSDWCK